MPTTRTPLKRRTRRRITPEALEAFKAGLRSAEQYWACIRDEACESTNPARHCPTCREHQKASMTLRLALGLPPWAFTPLDVGVDEPMPAYLVGSEMLSAKTWGPAVELRRELLAAIGATPA